MSRVCHLTSVHSPRDPRILKKECHSLANAGYEVHLIACSDKYVDLKPVIFHSIPIPRNRLIRMTITVLRIFSQALKIKGSLYHFHDPELIIIGLLLHILGKSVIYDIHEDNKAFISIKSYLPSWIRSSAAFVYDIVERISARFFTVIIAEKYYIKRFPHGHKVLNYPIVSAYRYPQMKTTGRDGVIYLGNITIDRGALVYADIVNRIDDLDVHLVGRCTEQLAEQLFAIAGSHKNRLQLTGVDQYVDHDRMLDYLLRGDWIAGLALAPPDPYIYEKELTKFFEYMMAGIPILCSQFRHWVSFVEDNGVGITAKSTDINDIVERLLWLKDNPSERSKMGMQGREWVENELNWNTQESNLLNIYDGLV